MVHFALSTFTLFALLVLFSTKTRTTFALNNDGALLLSFKYSILNDPLSVLENWDYEDATPCSWTGVTCTVLGPQGSAPDMVRVTSLVLPGSQLLGSLPSDLFNIEHLKNLDLSSNFLNGSLPDSLFNSSELEVVSLAKNEISGELPESVGGLKGLKVLNISDNALNGEVPQSLTTLKNLTVVSLRSNYFIGSVTSGFESVQVLDLSSNLLNGSLPPEFGGSSLHYLNLSYNRLSGPILAEFATKIPVNATIDLSFNNLTGAIPESLPLQNQKAESFQGNVDLCGKPSKNLCSIPSSLSTTPPNITSPIQSIPPAIAVIPKSIDPSPDQSMTNGNGSSSSTSQSQNHVKTGTVVTIVVADLAGIALLGLVILYVYQTKKIRKTKNNKNTTFDIDNFTTQTKFKHEKSPSLRKLEHETETSVAAAAAAEAAFCPCPCLKAQKGSAAGSSSSSSSSEEETTDSVALDNEANQVHDHESNRRNRAGSVKLVMVDGETELDIETLLKASAYVLGGAGNYGGSIVYKAVLENGTAFAVRRLGGEVMRMREREFESNVKFIAKFKHPNLVKVRGFYLGDDDEKLLLFDYVDNGCLATSTYRKPGSSPLHLSLEVRFKIARGVARGLAYIHDKKHVHGNIKPTNILLSSDMEPIISDFGVDRFMANNTNYQKTSNSGQGSASANYSVTASPSTFINAKVLPYQAPESLMNTPKRNPKWDVYSFGVILLELLTGMVFSERELNQWTDSYSLMLEDENRALKLVDAAIRADVEAKKDALLACLKLGFNCTAFWPQKRPTMKEALQILEKIP